VLFNSYGFIFLFLPVSFIIYFFLNNKRLVVAAKAWLVFTSLFFYSWWNVNYLPLILISILFNYTIAQSMVTYNNSRKKISKTLLLQIGLILNIGLLAYFKYMDFFISNTNYLIGTDFDLLHLALPLAISFFTLQQVAFLIDSYEGLAKEKDFLDYAVFVTFFPQLIAGPIVHHAEMMPQFSKIKNKVINYNNIAIGMFIFSIGLFKKVVIADSLATYVALGFDHSHTLNLIEAWATSFAYTFQLYFDFSGYTDMAIGAALLFNIKIPINFNTPLRATGIIEFWQKWHITLSNFITAYIYTPMVRSMERITFNKAMFATFITMLIAGLWHGASWTFVLFGGLHGVGLVVNNFWKKRKKKMPKFLAWLITFNFINITMVVFRAERFEDIEKILFGMFGLTGIILPSFLESKIGFLNEVGIGFGSMLSDLGSDVYIFAWIAIAFILALYGKNSIELSKDMKVSKMTLLVNSMFFFLTILYLNKNTVFIYFNF